MQGYQRFTPRTHTLPITEKDREVAAAFDPPKVMLGQPVIFYEKGVRSNDAYPGTILECNFKTGEDGVSEIVNRNAKIVLVNGSLIRACPHVDDPKLNWNYAIRSNGAWEIAPYEIQQNKELKQLTESAKSTLGQMYELYSKTQETFAELQKLISKAATTKKTGKDKDSDGGSDT